MTQYGVVLGGGGAKGCYEIGVWQALLELQVPICAVVGTSVGALNGAVMVQGDFDIAYQLWTNIDMQNVINLEKTIIMEKKQINLKELIATARKLIENRGLDITPLRETLLQYIDEDKIINSDVDFGLVTFSLTDFKPVTVFKDEIPKGLLIDYLLASSCLPGFQPLEINSKRFIDGGLYDNIPVSLMLKKNIKDIIVVDVSGIGRVRKVNLKGFNVIYIKNSDPLCKTLQFEAESAKKGITMGYLDTLRAFEKLQGKRYYIKASEEQNKLTAPLHEDELVVLDAMLDLKQSTQASNRLINYPLLHLMRKYVKGKLNSANLIQAAAEISAEVFGVERLKVYTWSELVQETLSAYNTVKAGSNAAKNQNLIKSLLQSTRLEDLETLDIKGLAAINTDFQDQDVNSKLYRKLMAIFAPKVCIANTFISLLLWRSRE